MSKTLSLEYEQFCQDPQNIPILFLTDKIQQLFVNKVRNHTEIVLDLQNRFKTVSEKYQKISQIIHNQKIFNKQKLCEISDIIEEENK